MKRVLVLTGRYLPKMSANGVCINNIIQRLPSNEYQVTCLCYDDLENMQDDVIRIVRISRGPIKSFLYKYEKNKSGIICLFKKIMSLILKFIDIIFLVSWPWNDPIFTHRVFKVAKKMHKESPFDYIIAVHMPLSSLIVANRMKKEFPNIIYVPYFLDSLSGGRPTSLLSSELNRKKKLNWERRLLPNADKIVVMEASRKHHEQFSSQLSYYNKFVYLDIPLLCSRDEFFNYNPFNNSKDEIRITYSGVALNPMRNMTFFSKFAKAVHNIDKRIVFYVIGQCNCVNVFDPSCIKYIQNVPHENLLPYLEYSDVLINFGVRVPSAISGKIFEYMSFGKPIISTYSILNEACITYLERYPLSLLIEESENEIEQAAQATIDFIYHNLGCRVDFDTIKDTFKNNLPETFIEEVFHNCD